MAAALHGGGGGGEGEPQPNAHVVFKTRLKHLLPASAAAAESVMDHIIASLEEGSLVSWSRDAHQRHVRRGRYNALGR